MTSSVTATSLDTPSESSPTLRSTELGDMPDDWNVDCLFKTWDVLDCKHVTAKFVFSGWPVASIQEVQSRFVDLRSAKQTTDDFYRLLIHGGRKPQPGDLILSRNATVGEVAQVAPWHPPFAMGQDVCLLRKRSQDYSTDFLQSLFRSDIIARQLENLMTGSTFRRVNVKQVKALFIPTPPPAEQRAIAAALSDVDELIGALDAAVSKKRAIKLAAMQQLLTGKTRLPGFSGEWKPRRLGQHATFLTHGTNARAELTMEGAVRYLHYGDIHASGTAHLSPDHLPFLPTQKAARLDRLCDGDLVLADASEDREGVGKSVEMQGLDDTESVAGLHTITVRFDKAILADGYKGYLQCCPPFRNALQRLAAGTKVYAITKNHVASIEMALPSAEEQTAIAAVLSDMDAEIAALEQRRDKTNAIKQGMMQALLTGRVRLVEPERSS